jgi:hypothetical protein
MEDWKYSAGWCLDSSRYAAVKRNAPLRTKMSAADIELMLNAHTVRRLRPGERPHAFCNVFCVAEWSKQRRRRVCHPEPVNDACDRSTLRPLHCPSRQEIRSAAHQGGFVACLDASSFFDQFGLTDEVALNFCFRDAQGDTYCLTALAMGQRQSTEVATALMRVLASFERPKVRVDIATDNIRFIGPQREVRAAVVAFLARCNKVGVVLNELTSKASAADIDRVVTTEADFLGEVIDYRQKTVRCRQKIVDHAKELWDLRHSWTNRQQIGFVAILLWCSAPLRVPLVRRYASLSFLRQQGRRLHDDPALWDQPAHIPPEVKTDLAEWYSAIVANRPTAIEQPGRPDDYILFTDASEWGWAAAWVDASGGATFLDQRPWGDTLHLAHRSTTSEPEAVWRSLCRFLNPTRQATVRVLSDHSPFVDAVNKGHSASAGNNGVLARIAERFPKLTLRAVHIPGELNPTDELSRQQATTEMLDRARRGVRDMVGSARGRAALQPQPLPGPPGVPSNQ